MLSDADWVLLSEGVCVSVCGLSKERSVENSGQEGRIVNLVFITSIHCYAESTGHQRM